MLLLEQNTIKIRRIDDNTIELEADNSKKYKVDAILNIVIYGKKLAGQLLELYYLIL